MEKVFKAIEYAVQAHAGQYRKGRRIPYIFHPIAAAWTLVGVGVRRGSRGGRGAS